MPLELTSAEREMLEGAHGRATAMAMRVVTAAADFVRAGQLVEITSAHIDGCLHHGDGGVEFAEKLVAGGGSVAVPTTLNVGALDLLHPEVVRADAHDTEMARRQMSAYLKMGAQPTFTCAPYQVGHEPGPGEQVAWGESNAIAFVNSVLGARTERYGDFLDACCALTGRAPLHGLHRAENRYATLIVDVSGIPAALKSRDVFFPVFGTWLGLETGGEIVAVRGMPSTTTRDQLKALGAAAASTGAVALFHVVGVTPEAPTLDAALGHGHAASSTRTLGPPGGVRTSSPPGWRTQPDVVYPRRIEVTADMMRDALTRLSTASGVDQVDAVAVGSPHFSREEFRALDQAIAGRDVTIPFYVCTARDTLAEVDTEGIAARLRKAGVTIVVDTCVVVTPILPARDGVLMTNSGKFAHYGPANTGYEVVYGSLEDCVETARTGRIVRNEGVWSW